GAGRRPITAGWPSPERTIRTSRPQPRSSSAVSSADLWTCEWSKPGKAMLGIATRRSRSARTPGITRSMASRSCLMSLPEWYDGPRTGPPPRPPSVAAVRGAVAAAPPRGLPGGATGGRQPLAQASGAGADPLADLLGASGHPAHQLEQRVLGALEGLPVGVGRPPDVLRHRRLLGGVAAWVVAGR